MRLPLEKSRPRKMASSERVSYDQKYTSLNTSQIYGIKNNHYLEQSRTSGYRESLLKAEMHRPGRPEMVIFYCLLLVLHTYTHTYIYIHIYTHNICIHTRYVCVYIYYTANSLGQGIPQSLYLHTIQDMLSLALGITVIPAIYNCSFLPIVIYSPFPEASVLPLWESAIGQEIKI